MTRNETNSDPEATAQDRRLRSLVEHGFDVVALVSPDGTVEYASPAIELARSYRPEVILLDIGLPGMDGYEVVERLRAEASCKDALIVAVSGYGQEEDRRRSREAGFDQPLVKPVDYDALMAVFARSEGGGGVP